MQRALNNLGGMVPILNLVTHLALASLFLSFIIIDGIEFVASFSSPYKKSTIYEMLGLSFKLTQIVLALAVALAIFERQYIRAIVWFGIWLIFSVFVSSSILHVEGAGLDDIPYIISAVVFQISTLGFALAIIMLFDMKGNGHRDKQHKPAFDPHKLLSDEDVISSFLSDSIVRAKGQSVGARDLYNAYSRYCDELETKAVAERLFSGIVKANNIAHKRQSKGSFYLGVMFKPNGFAQIFGKMPGKVV